MFGISARKLGALLVCLLGLAIFTSAPVWAGSAPPVVWVDGRRVELVSSEAQLGGALSNVPEVLAQLGNGTVADLTVEEFDPDDAGGTPTPLAGVGMEVVDGHIILLTGLEQHLADLGRIGIWVSGTTSGGTSWRICIVIRWDAKANLEVVVDGRYAAVVGLPAATVDGSAADPLAALNWQTEDYAWLTRRLCDIADAHAHGRIVSTLEGGYDLAALQASVAAHVGVLEERGR